MTETKVFGYYPGCELRSRARALDLPARSACRSLGIVLEELKDWTCCGSLVSQVRDNYMAFVAPARVLLDAHVQGYQELVTVCAFCFNTLRRTSVFLRSHPDARQKVATFLEAKEFLEVRVLHLLEVLRDHIGFDRLRQAVRRPLKGLRVAPYYGCLLLRPAEEVKLDNPEEPTLMENLLAALGCEVVDFLSRTDCCGSYHIVTDGQIAAQCSDRILRVAARDGAELLVASCPVCQFNLDWRRSERRRNDAPVVYFPQLLALALGEPAEDLAFSQEALRVLSLKRNNWRETELKDPS